MAVMTAGVDEERVLDAPLVVRERLEAFGVGVLADAMNRPVQVRNGGLYLRGLLERGARKSLDKVDTENGEHGPLLIISGEKDHTVPWAIANASYKRQQRNEGVTEIVEIPNRGHSLTIDSGWREVCDEGLEFVQRFV